MTAVPPHKLSETNNTRRIDIFSWSIETVAAPIINASESDTLQATLGIPLPEMTFGNNSLELTHNPSGFKYRFDAENALKHVKRGELEAGDGGIKVGYADAWLKSRVDPDSSIPFTKTVATKPYDWTYTSTYPGHLVDERFSFVPADPNNPHHVIPIAELTRLDPILFYAEIPLYEDELHDNGMSQVTIRVRVMPTSFFLLARFTLRVDNVLFRTCDTRIYHSFASSPPLIVREYTGWEAPYQEIKKQLPIKNDLTPLIDPNFVAKSLTTLPPSLTQEKGAGTGWRALGTHLQVATIL
ncbi:type 2A phosphatase activator TIP41 [Hysterangium stoloniferum]|nr:type 2A phosphatase activator TIP41 [Hysterangium stoloniferum]